ncbi:hypothetical protein [Methylobacterium segetis]|uniref:hypothetical protein n=1 Tax=Methylobacterium segetis TaxID=2488750 RepID=UPI001A9D5AE8|nr:hypothetical protein [Methylobacterium segetis]
MTARRAVEAPLRTVVALRGAPALKLSAWRGASGRRYVVGIHPAEVGSVEDCGPAVVLAVRRADSGLATLLQVEIAEDPGVRNAATWLHNVRAQGCNEIHIHRLCDGPAEMAAVTRDLSDQGDARPAAHLALVGGRHGA